MYERFRLVGVSYRTSPIEVREIVALDDADARRLLTLFKETLGLEEALIISTCNRTEFYYSHSQDISAEILAVFRAFKGIAQYTEVFGCFRTKNGEAAAQHLFEVALGLDAKVLGDLQISNQVKRAYQASADLQMAGPFLHRLLHAIFFANKRVVQETIFRDGAASTSFAVADLTSHFIKNFVYPKVLILGAGEIGENVADNFRDLPAHVTIANRTVEKAIDLAAKYNFEALSLDNALNLIGNFDVIISSVSVSQPLISKHHFAQTGIIQKLLIDLSVPRTIEPSLEELPGILLYNIDQIEEKTSYIREKRKTAIPAVEQIIADAMTELKEWATEMEVSPTIKKLKQALEDIRQEEMARYLKKADKEQLELLDQATKNMIQRVLKLPVLQLKAACKRGEAETLIEVLNDLFNLEKVKDPS